MTFAESAQAQDPDEPFYAFIRTNALLRLGRPEEALASARETLERFPGLPDALYHLAVVEMGLGHRRSAEGHLRAALTKAPDHFPSLSDLAVLLTFEKRFAEAREIFEHALRLRPADPTLRDSYRRFEVLSAAPDG